MSDTPDWDRLNAELAKATQERDNLQIALDAELADIEMAVMAANDKLDAFRIEIEKAKRPAYPNVADMNFVVAESPSKNLGVTLRVWVSKEGSVFRQFSDMEEHRPKQKKLGETSVDDWLKWLAKLVSSNIENARRL